MPLNDFTCTGECPKHIRDSRETRTWHHEENINHEENFGDESYLPDDLIAISRKWCEKVYQFGYTEQEKYELGKALGYES